jgi:hypothetical protein
MHDTTSSKRFPPTNAEFTPPRSEWGHCAHFGIARLRQQLSRRLLQLKLLLCELLPWAHCLIHPRVVVVPGVVCVCVCVCVWVCVCVCEWQGDS